MDNISQTVKKRPTETPGETATKKKPRIENIASTPNLAENPVMLPENSYGSVSIKSEPPGSNDGDIREEGEIADNLDISEIKKENDLNAEECFDKTTEENDLQNKQASNEDDNGQDKDMAAMELNNIKNNLKIVHLKNVRIAVNGETIPLLNLTEFPVNDKFYFIRKLRDESNRILHECLLKFNDPADAAMVASSLNSVTYKDCLIQAELKPNNYVPETRLYYDSHPKGNSDLGSNTEDGEEISKKLKIAKFDDVWEVANPKSKSAWVTRSTKDTFGINPYILRQHGTNNLSQCISVDNLQEDVTEAKLHEVFSMAGNVRYINFIQKSKINKARIEYEHPVEALQAVSMFNGQNLYGLDLKVKVFTSPCPRSLPDGLGGIGKGFGDSEKPLQSVAAYVNSRRMDEIFYDMGKVQKTVDSQHSFLGYYSYKNAPVNASDKTKFSGTNKIIATTSKSYAKTGTEISGINKKVVRTSKPDANTAIEALGAVLVALDLIPPQTNHKDLKSIVNALQQHPKVKQHAASKKKNKKNNVQQKQMAKQPPVQQQKSKVKQPPKVKPQGNSATRYQEFIRSLNNNSNFLQRHAPTIVQRTISGPQSATNNNYNNMSQSNNNPDVQNVPNDKQYQTNAGANANTNNSVVYHQNKNPETSDHGYGVPNRHQNMANSMNMSQNIPDSPLPPRWGDPRAQGIPQNFPQKNSNTNFRRNSNSAPLHRHPNSNDYQNSQSPPRRPHYDPRNESRHEEIDSRDNFKSDLCQLKNLPASVTSISLIQKMEEVGDIIFAEMTGRGQALVRFKKVSDADRCIRMFHRTKVDGFVIDVSPV